MTIDFEKRLYNSRQFTRQVKVKGQVLLQQR